MKNAPNLSARYAGQRETVDSVRQIDRDLYVMECRYDYRLDALLEKGAANTADLFAKVSANLFCGDSLPPLRDGGFACSAFDAYNENGDHLMGRNFDYKAAPVMALRCAPAGGYQSVAFVDCNFMACGYDRPRDKTGWRGALLAPFCCVDGINEKGLAIEVNELKTQATAQRTGKTPVTTTLMIRAVLDKAATVEDALSLFRRYDMRAAFGVDYHFLLADAGGHCALVEYIHNEMTVLYPEKHTEEGLPFLAVTNGYIDPRGPAVKRPGGYRLRCLNETLTASGARLSERQCLDLLRRVRLQYRHQLGHRVITLWSAVYNCNRRAVSLIAGDNDRDVFRFTVGREEWRTE